MKKVFVILLAVLLLSMIGTVSAEDTVITNITVKDNATVPVILDLKNGYRITIPAAINFVAYDLDQTDPDKGREYLASSEIDIHVILLGANQNITVKISSDQYDNNRYEPAGNTNDYKYDQGAWRLNATGGNSVHYLISNSSSQLAIDSKDIVNMKYKFTSGDDCFVYNNSIIADTNVSTKVYIHAAVADIPKNTVPYRDNLKFVVNVTNS